MEQGGWGVGFRSVVCDDGCGSGWAVADEVTGGGDEVVCKARRCLVSGR